MGGDHGADGGSLRDGRRARVEHRADRERSAAALPTYDGLRSGLSPARYGRREQHDDRALGARADARSGRDALRVHRSAGRSGGERRNELLDVFASATARDADARGAVAVLCAAVHGGRRGPHERLSRDASTHERARVRGAVDGRARSARRARGVREGAVVRRADELSCARNRDHRRSIEPHTNSIRPRDAAHQRAPAVVALSVDASCGDDRRSRWSGRSHLDHAGDERCRPERSASSDAATALTNEQNICWHLSDIKRSL